MTLTLYSGAPSSNALKVRFLLAHLELEHELVEVPMERPRPAWFVEFQPAGTVPALRDGELVIGESNAILRYLAAREGRDDLYPEELGARSRVEWAIDLWTTAVRPALRPIEREVLADRAADEAAVAAALPRAERSLAAFERLLAGGDSALGRLTIADFCVTPVLWRSRLLPVDFEPYPKLTHLRDALPALPAFAAAGPVI
jgi:glutathione S-transferase